MAGIAARNESSAEGTNDIVLSDGTFACVSGRGPAVVFLHGIGLDHSIWAGQVAAFRDHTTTVTYDILGHGRSAKPPVEHTIGLYVRQLELVLRELQLDRAVVVGFSLGSLIARAFAIRHPERVAGLGILHTWFQRTPAETRRVAERLAAAERLGPSSGVDAALVRWFSEGFRRRAPLTLSYVAGLLTANEPHSFISAYRIVAAEGSPEVDALHAITCPTLVMTAEEDYGNSPGMSTRVSENIAGSELVILPGLRHMALLEDPAAVNEPLARLIRRAVAVAPS